MNFNQLRPARQPGKLAEVESRTKIYATWISVAALVIGGMFTLWEYYDAKKRARVEETLRYVRSYNADEMFKANRVIDLALVKIKEDLVQNIKTGTNEEFADLILALVNTSAGSKAPDALEPNIWMVTDFYETLYICIDGNLCDRAASYSFFGERARDFFYMFLPYLKVFRSYDRTFAETLAKFVCDYQSFRGEPQEHRGACRVFS